MTAIGADSTAVRAKGEKTVVGAVSDAATGEALGADALSAIQADSWSGLAVSGSRRWVADDLGAYKPFVNVWESSVRFARRA